MSATKTKTPRIDNLQVGSIVTLDLFTRSSNPVEEKVMFMGIKGEGEDREASFMMLTGGHDSTYTWEAYRYNGRWVWGSSADTLRLVGIDATPIELLASAKLGTLGGNRVG